MDRDILSSLVREDLALALQGGTEANNAMEAYEKRMEDLEAEVKKCPGIYGIWIANKNGRTPSANTILQWINKAENEYIKDPEYSYQVDHIIDRGYIYLKSTCSTRIATLPGRRQVHPSAEFTQKRDVDPRLPRRTRTPRAYTSVDNL